MVNQVCLGNDCILSIYIVLESLSISATGPAWVSAGAFAGSGLALAGDST